MMLFPSLQSLLDLCAIRIAYLMWTRRDVVKKCSKEGIFDECSAVELADMQRLPLPKCPKEELFDEFEGVVLADVQSLPLPKQVKSRILNNVKPAGKRLLSFLNLWLSKTQPENSQEWLTDEMLFECLILNADGLINQRRTAEKILSRRMLHNVLAFRLACVNFLENEVLKLWIFVRQYFLNKIILEGEQPHSFLREYSFREILVKTQSLCCASPYMLGTANFPRFPCTREPDEVLFWISYCLSKENAIAIKEVPHFMGHDVDWYEFSLESAALSGNVSCFDYFKNFCKRKVDYSHIKIIQGIFSPYGKDCGQPCLVFYFMLLNWQERTELLRKRPMHMLSHFLQWPLSQTFVENTEEMWNLIRDDYKDWVLLKIFTILFNENILLNPITNCDGFPCSFLGVNTLIHRVEHLKGIWIALWEISLDSYKLKVLNSIVFKSIVHSRRRREFRTNFKAI
ncbi:hypothetical protein AVEN_207051-1 [Araneus ventricosus]|uniref:Uncharacterized protein n=1 Tax=Araneus ventricosus TaxID=182803 RepID=A0A4Y2JZB8_ARAVE|nr:hypothetical protein AVEN_207051-1 [Araneus ventricosus]